MVWEAYNFTPKPDECVVVKRKMLRYILPSCSLKILHTFSKMFISLYRRTGRTNQKVVLEWREEEPVLLTTVISYFEKKKEK